MNVNVNVHMNVNVNVHMNVNGANGRSTCGRPSLWLVLPLPLGGAGADNAPEDLAARRSAKCSEWNQKRR